jgi:hypothetical protein
MQGIGVSFVLVALLIGATPVAAFEPPRPDLVCPAPISTCETQPDSEQSCPAGYRCVCVPSCPNCRDCAAQVCVADPREHCQTACDCSPGLMCDDGRCAAGIAPVFCCESDRCPIGQQCQHRDGNLDRCGQQCQTACDCEPGLGCFDGQCIAGFAPVYCCEADQCPGGQQCQHRDGRQDRCAQPCVTQAWRCDTPGNPCDEDRVCACTASCPGCEDCGPGVCLPRGTSTPYRCEADGSCKQPGDRCQCVSSCPECDDCALSVCVPSCDPMCDRRQRISSKRIDRIIDLTRRCRSNADCVRVDADTACRDTCGVWVNERYAERVKKLIDYVDQRYCATFRSDGCARPVARCRRQTSACVDHRCTGISP